MMASMPLCLFGECHAPYVGCGVGISTLRYEVDVSAVVAPYGAEVVGGMVEFGKKDIVRHHLVQRIVEAYQHYDDEMKSQRDTPEQPELSD